MTRVTPVDIGTRPRHEAQRSKAAPVSPFSLGATLLEPGRCAFRVWAPRVETVDVVIHGSPDRVVQLHPQTSGYHESVVEDACNHTLYTYRLNRTLERPDPASRYQPHGVHGPSAVVASRTSEPRDWNGIPLGEYIIYELHVGTFSHEGTFEGMLPHLRSLRDLGITAIELMPVAQFPGTRNWGYDGVLPFAAQNSYGGPDGLRRLVREAHRLGLAVILDVVYNHLGPEGNHLADFGPYFTDAYRTPWGQALNFDGAGSDEVRQYFLENAAYWQSDLQIDALRLDAIHAIRDFSAVTFLEDLATSCNKRAQQLGGPFYLIGESDMNMARHILPQEANGYGLDAQWSDDFHHCLHGLLTGEKEGYYVDYAGVPQLAKAWSCGYSFTGEFSRFRNRRHGSNPDRNHVKQFVVCSSNHDQIGNRMLGDRLSTRISFEQQKLAAGALLLCPFIPLIFMGDEYGETAPFQYFVSHTDPALVEAVRKGRSEEFASFKWAGEVPDPQSESTFLNSRLDHTLHKRGFHHCLRDFHRELMVWRKALHSIHSVKKGCIETRAVPDDTALIVRQWSQQDEACIILAFKKVAGVQLPVPEGTWELLLNSNDERWGGSGPELPGLLESTGLLSMQANAPGVVLLRRLIKR